MKIAVIIYLSMQCFKHVNRIASLNDRICTWYDLLFYGKFPQTDLK